MEILFVCDSNRSASPMAAAFLDKRLREMGNEEYVVRSAGLKVQQGDSLSKGARAVLEADGIKPLAISVKQLGLKDIKQADLIVCLTSEQAKKVNNYPSAAGKVIHLMSLADGAKRDVFEPRSTLTCCRQCLNFMKNALGNLAKRLAE